MKISLRIRKLWHFEVLQIFKNWIIMNNLLCARQNDVNATQRSAGNSFCQAHAFQSGHLLQLITNSSFVWFIGQNFIASQILSSKIISWNFICNAKGIFKSWWVLSFTTFCWEQAHAFTLSVFLPGAHVHVVLPGTQQIMQMSELMIRCHHLTIFNSFCTQKWQKYNISAMRMLDFP